MRTGRLIPALAYILILMTFGTISNGRTLFTPSQSIATQAVVPTDMPTAQVPLFEGIVAVTFVDAQHGWMLSNYELDGANEELTVDATTDGGNTWHVLTVLYSTSPDAALNAPESTPQANPNQVSELRFANTQDGWAFGPDLLVTHDGGKTWKKQAEDADVLDFEIVGGTVWMLQASCPGFGECESPTIRTSTDNGQTWRSNPPLTGMVPQKFVVSDGQTAWILHDTYTANAGILATHDSGKTWEAVTFPTDCDLGNYDLAAADSQHLWFASGTEGAGDLGAKRICTSSDGGKNWKLTAKADLPAGADDNLSGLGAIEHLYAFPAQSAWVTLYRANPIITNDGGKTWHSPDITAYTEAGTIRMIIWVDPLHIWYYNNTWLFRTDDGGSSWVCQRALIDWAENLGCAS